MLCRLPTEWGEDPFVSFLADLLPPKICRKGEVWSDGNAQEPKSLRACSLPAGGCSHLRVKGKRLPVTAGVPHRGFGEELGEAQSAILLGTDACCGHLTHGRGSGRLLRPPARPVVLLIPLR